MDVPKISALECIVPIRVGGLIAVEAIAGIPKQFQITCPQIINQPLPQVSGRDHGVNLGPAFPYGLFVCHANGKPSIVTAYEDLGLEIDTSYDPRTGMYSSE